MAALQGGQRTKQDWGGSECNGCLLCVYSPNLRAEGLLCTRQGSRLGRVLAEERHRIIQFSSPSTLGTGRSQ